MANNKFNLVGVVNLQLGNTGRFVSSVNQQLNSLNSSNLGKVNSQIRNYNSNIRNASNETSLFGRSVREAFSRFTVVAVVTGTLVGLTRSLKNAVSEAISFEREMNKIEQASGKNAFQLRTLSNTISDVSTKYGVASKELSVAARNLIQAGYSASKVSGLLDVLAQTEVAATFDNITDTTEGMIAILSQFGKEATRTGNEVEFLRKTMSSINEVSKAFAVESADIITAVRTAGSAFEAAGGTFDEFNALFTSVRATTRESAESIATGFRTIFTRVQRVDTLEALKNLGIELQDVEGKFVGPLEAVKRLSAALNTIDPRDYRFNIVTEQLGGYRQIQKVIPLIQQLSMTEKALAISQQSTDSTAKDAEIAQKSLAVQIEKTRQEFQRFVRDLVAGSEFKKLAQWALEFANALIKVADSLKPLLPLLGPIAVGKIGASLMGTVAQFGGYSVATKGSRKYATGGSVVPGSGDSDTIPAMLTPGEFVLTKKAAQKIGYGNLKRLNKIHKFAHGGTAGGNFVGPQNQYRIPQFIQQISGQVDTQTLTEVEAVLKRIANAGLDLESAMESLDREISRHGVAFDLKEALPRVQNAATGGEYAKSMQQQVKSAFGERGKRSPEQEELRSSIKQSTIMFGLLATSVISSMDSMKEFGDTAKKVGESAAIFGSNFVAVKTIGLGVSEVANKLGGVYPKFQKFGDGLDKLITGFAIARGIIAIQAAQSAEALKKNVAIIDQTIEALAKNRAVDEKSNTKNMQESLINDMNTKSWNSLGTNIAMGVGATIFGGLTGALGFLAGGPALAGVTGVAGGTAGGALGANVAYELGVGSNPQLIKESASLAKKLSSSMISVNESLKALNKGMEDLGETTNEELNKKFMGGIENFVRDTNSLTNQNIDIKRLYGDIDNAPESVKKSLNQQSSDLESTFTTLNNLMGEINKRFAQEVSTRINQKDFDPYKFATQEARKMAPQVYDAAFAKALNETGSRKKASEEADKAYEDFATQLYNTTARIDTMQQKMLEAQLREIAIRNRLIGTIAEEIATENAMGNLTYTLDKTMKAFNAFGDALEMQSSRIIDPSLLDVKVVSPENQKDYDRALNSIAAISPDGDKLIKNFKELQAVSLKLQVALEKNPLAIAQSEKETDNFIKSLGVAAGSGTEMAIRDAIKAATKIDQASDAGRGNKKELGRQTVEAFDKYKDQIGKVMRDYLTKQNDVFANEVEIRKQQNAIYKEQLEIQMGGLEQYIKLNENIASALGQEVSLRDKYNAIAKRQTALSGGMAGDPAKIFERLKTLSDQSDMTFRPDQAQAIAKESDNLKIALKELANQSDKTSAVMEEIQRIKGLREIFKEFSSSAAFGTGEQRYNMSKTFAQAMQLAMTGNVNFIPDNDRNAVQALLKQFKDLPIFNGMTGKQVENMAVANFLRSIGAFPAAQMIANDTSAPEQKMIAELRNIYEQEKVARAKLIEIEQAKIDKRNTALNLNTEAINKLIDNIKNVSMIVNPQGFASGGPVGKGFKPKGTDTIPAMLSKGEFVMNKKAVDNIGLDNLNAMNNVQYFAKGGRASRSLYLRRAKERPDLAQSNFMEPQEKEIPNQSLADITKQNAILDARAKMGRDAIAKLPKYDESYYEAKRKKATEDTQRRNLYAQSSIQTENQKISNRNRGREESPELIEARKASALDRIDVNPLIYESRGITKEQYVKDKYGDKKPKNMSMDVWYNRIAKSRDQEKSNFFKGVSQKAVKSPLSNYGKKADSPYNYELQQSLEKAKTLGQQADSKMEAKFGVKPGQNYKSLEDVPVLNQEQIGKTMSPKQLSQMEKRAQTNTPFYYNGTNLSPTQEMANKASQNFKKPYQGSSPYERYLNADSQNKFVDSTRNRFQQNKGVSFSQMATPSNPAMDILNRNNGRPNLTSPVGGLDGMPVDKLQQFGEQFRETVSMLNGMTMTHKATVDGQLNIGGINAPEVAEAIKTAIGDMIKQEVERVFNSKGRQAQ